MSDEIDHHLNLEEDFLSKDRKFEKKYKKALTKKDRSKFKKTDQDKIKKHHHDDKKNLSQDLNKGRVLEITPENIIIDFNGEIYLCTLKGLLKKEITKNKNLIAVGDFVFFDILDSDTGVITTVIDRFSILSREENLRRIKQQIIAANIDQVLITISIFLPKLKPSLVDRYIISAKKGNMKPVMVLNKHDLLDNPPPELSKEQTHEEITKYHEFKKIYSQLGYPYLELSATQGEGLKNLKSIMQGKASVFSGQSGVGKTSLINALFNTDYKTRDIIKKTYKGAHTTTSAKLIKVGENGFCIDTPGIKSFGIWQLNFSDLHSHFKEFHKYEPNCKYPNCTHKHEPDCAVKQALDKGEISLMRYQSYIDLLDSIS